jgi:hypothetical protein
MANNIVTVVVTQTVAAAPVTLQQTGALVSQGGTALTPGTTAFLTQESDLVVSAAKTIAAATWSANVATITTSAAHGWPLGGVFLATITGMLPAGYNGTFEITPTTTTQFTYALVTNPGSATAYGTVIPASVAELESMVTTFFANGNATGVYVLELGANSPSAGVTALVSYINNNLGVPPSGQAMGQGYRYLVPREWDALTAFENILENYDGDSALTYFHVTTTTGTYEAYAGHKCVMTWVEAPSIPSTEFSAAADFYVALNYAPSSVNKVPPNSNAFIDGVTPYPLVGNQTLLGQLKTAFVNVVGTGAQGGISNKTVSGGYMMDGNILNYWYSVDYVQLNMAQNLANEVINGSNNPVNPLFYDQNGVNRLEGRGQSTMNTAVQVGLALGPVTVSAVSFTDWVTANPETYPAGQYGGISTVFTPQGGFQTITVNVQVSNIPILGG